MSRIASQKSRRQKNLTAFSQFATKVALSQDGGLLVPPKPKRGRTKGSSNQNAHWVHPSCLQNFTWNKKNVPNKNLTLIDPNKYYNYYQKPIPGNYHRCPHCGTKTSKLGVRGNQGTGHLEGDSCTPSKQSKERERRQKKYVNVDTRQSSLSMFTVAAGG